MTSGHVLSQWLQRQHGSVVRGSSVSLSQSGLLRVSDAQSRPVQVMLPVVHGGQAAVARVVDPTGTSLALRVQAVASDAEKARQMERLVSMTTVAEAARDRPERFPAVLPVLESFVLVVPGADVSSTASEPEYELWCDLMTWCPHDLNGWAEAVPVASRPLDTVLGMFLPLLETVHAVHQDLGIVHRDITPNNVLVDEQDRWLLADWGIAHGLAAGQTSTYTQLVGNRGFALPPEMETGDSSVGRYTDAWYLGSLLVWMLTGQPPGPQHGSRRLPPGLPDGPVGDQVAAVVRGLCCLDPRGRMDLGQAQAVLTDAAAGRVSTHLAGPDTAGAGLGGAAVGPGMVPEDVVPEPAPGPAAGDQDPSSALADGTSQPDGSDPTSPQPDTAGDKPRSRPSRAARLWLAAAAMVVVVVVGGLWAASRLPGGGGRPGAAASSPGQSSASVPATASSDGEEAGGTGDESGSGGEATAGDQTAGAGGGGAGGGGAGGGAEAGGDTGLCVPASQTCPVYSAARVQPILDDLYASTGGTQFAEINLYEKTVTVTALTKPGATTFDDYYWSGGQVVGHHLSQVQPSSDRVFDATTVDWSQAERLANRLPELTGVDRPAAVAVRVCLGSANQVEFTVSTWDDDYTPSVTADKNGNIKWMRGGRPGTPAAG